MTRRPPPLNALALVFGLALPLGACEKTSAPVTSEVETTSALRTIAEPGPVPSASAPVPHVRTEWTPSGPRTFSAPDLHDMGMHHPPTGQSAEPPETRPR